MSELEALLDQLFGRDMQHAGEGIDGAAWSNLEDTGLTRVGIDESLGGSGGDREDSAEILIKAGEAGLNVPLTESLLLAAHIAATTATPMPPGTVAVGLGRGNCASDGDGYRITASCTGVPWGAAAQHLWLLTPVGRERLVFAQLTDGQWTAASEANLAGEPRDHIAIDAVVHREHVQLLQKSRMLDDLQLLGALGRSCQTLGALRSSFRLSKEYVRLRHQFKKPLAAHQAVRHALAEIACEVAAAETAVSHALTRLPHPGSTLETETALAIAAAKVQTARSATRVARTAHQLHGAVGLTAEHPLHHFSTRLWSWRNEFGSAAHWSGRIAEMVRKDYDNNLWAALTSQS